MLHQTTASLLRGAGPECKPVTNGDAIPTHKGNGIWHRKLSLEELVQLAADLRTGAARLHHLTTRQVCSLLEIPARLVEEEIRARKFHQAPTNDAEVSVEEGPTDGGSNDAPLPSSPPPVNEGMPFPAWCIVAAWRGGSPADRIRAIRELGTDEIWYALVAAVNADAVAVETADND